jgi:hypothetical protein
VQSLDSREDVLKGGTYDIQVIVLGTNLHSMKTYVVFVALTSLFSTIPLITTQRSPQPRVPLASSEPAEPQPFYRKSP